MPQNLFIKKIMKRIFAVYKEDGALIFVILGIKIKFKYPGLNRLEEICAIQNLEKLLENNTKFPHPIGIVINKNAKIGKNCTIWQNVTIGDGFRDKNGSRYPIIGDNVEIFANAVIIGGITIGDNAVIGAGSVVVHDVPANAIVAGNPAKIIRQNNYTE